MATIDRRDVLQGSMAALAVLAAATESAAAAAPGAFYVIAEVTAKPGSEDELRRLLTKLAHESKRRDKGCKSYTLLEVGTEPGRFFTFEIWTDRAALDGHMAAPHVRDLLPQLGPLLAKPPTQTFLGAVTIG
jgi:quinol monooxygenase YgiN